MKKFLGIALALVLVLGCAAIASADVGSGLKVPDGALVGWGEVSLITEIAGHAITGTPDIVKKPTCTETGMATFDCDVGEAGKHVHVIIIAADKHKWASEQDDKDWGKVIETPTCQKEGKAQDECIVCHTTREVYRTIDKVPHEYDNDHLQVYKEATCTKSGLKRHLCIYCNQYNPGEIVMVDEEIDGVKTGKKIETNPGMVKYGPLDHDLTDWTQTKAPTCVAYGTAYRTCTRCNYIERLDGNSTEKALDKDGKVKKVKDANGNEQEVLLKDDVPAVAILNPNYPTTYTAAFTTEAEYAAYLKGFEHEETRNWLNTCYEREIELICPYCGKLKAGNEKKNAAHQPIKVTLGTPLTIAHEWNEKPEPNDKDKTPGISLAPTCVEDGYNVYLCKYDATGTGTGIPHGHADEITGERVTKAIYEAYKAGKLGADVTNSAGIVKKDCKVKIELVPALGHNFGDWQEFLPFTKDNEDYVVYVSRCQNEGCIATKNITIKKGEKLPDPNGKETVEPTVDPKTEDPKTEDPKTEDPKTEDPKTEDPKTEEPKTEEPKTEEPTEEPAEKKNGLCQDEDGKWKYFKDDKVDTTKTDIVEFQGGKFWVVDGVLADEATGLVVCPDGEAYLMYKGQILYVSQIAMYDGQWFMVKDGKLDKTATGLYEYDGSTFAFKDGRIAKEYNGLYPDGDKWVFLANGQVQEQFSGVTIYDDHAFLLKNGTLDKEYEGEYVYDGATFIVVEGQLYPAA